MNARDPLSCVCAFRVATTVIVPLLYGLRMCPDCPNCAESECPCMDASGSNGTPMGGSGGRADAMIGAAEAQKAEGVLHIHLFMFFQWMYQFCTLKEIADRMRAGLVTVQALKKYHDAVRRAAYPDVSLLQEQKKNIDKA